MLKKDIEDIASRLEEAGSNTATQVELNKKRENEITKMKKDFDLKFMILKMKDLEWQVKKLKQKIKA